MKTIGPPGTQAKLLAPGRDVSFALPVGASTLRPTHEQINAAAEWLRISTSLAERALNALNLSGTVMAATNQSLIIMACSATKLPHAAPALELYQGVMYSTFRANLPPHARPHVVILSALHGFVAADRLIDPYEQRMNADRAALMVRDLAGYLGGGWPTGATNVLLAGGSEYRRVMHMAMPELVERGHVAREATIAETTGGIGYQRQQLGAFLRDLAGDAREVVGYQANGTPLHRTLKGFAVDQPVTVAYRIRPDKAARPAVIEELFDGPAGPTASVLMLDARNANCARTWVGLEDLQPRRDTLF